MKNTKNIVLIGMPGSGKSTAGVVLAKRLGYAFVDVDLLIIEKAGKRLQEILDEDGLECFLRLENEVGSSIRAKRTVIATGGSMVLSSEAMANLKQNGTVVFIDVPLDEIKRRVTDIKTRGIAFDDGETLDDIYRARQPLYEKYADLTVTLDAENVGAAVDSIISGLGIENS